MHARGGGRFMTAISTDLSIEPLCSLSDHTTATSDNVTTAHCTQHTVIYHSSITRDLNTQTLSPWVAQK